MYHQLGQVGVKDKKYLKMRWKTDERFHEQIVEEMKETEQKKTEEALRMVRRRRCTIYGDIRRLQSSGNSRRVRKELGLQHPTSSESCRSSMVDYDEEMAMEPPRERPEWPEWEEARGGEEDAWRLEPEGKTEVPETVIFADEVEGTYVDSNGEGHHGRGKVKNHRSQRCVQGQEGEEIKIRVRRERLLG